MAEALSYEALERKSSQILDTIEHFLGKAFPDELAKARKTHRPAVVWKNSTTKIEYDPSEINRHAYVVVFKNQLGLMRLDSQRGEIEEYLSVHGPTNRAVGSEIGYLNDTFSAPRKVIPAEIPSVEEAKILRLPVRDTLESARRGLSLARRVSRRRCL